ncbi:MAG TPA: hypothetical protein VNI20_01125 [Fimbriimonadaceae bacterium]|nr:hypothetical protein [Fimbriimonadaceae bacterium]
MRHKPNERLQALVSVALGEQDESSLGRLTAREAERLSGLRRIAAALKSEWHIAPPELRESLRQIFPAGTPSLMRLVASSLGAGGVRSLGAETVHASYVHEDDSVRILYAQEGDGWNISGQAPGGGWNVICEDTVGKCDEDGRFAIFVRCDAIPEITLTKAGRTLVLPPPAGDQ